MITSAAWRPQGRLYVSDLAFSYQAATAAKDCRAKRVRALHARHVHASLQVAKKSGPLGPLLTSEKLMSESC
jgi:hypothetical protein